MSFASKHDRNQAHQRLIGRTKEQRLATKLAALHRKQVLFPDRMSKAELQLLKGASQ